MDLLPEQLLLVAGSLVVEWLQGLEKQVHCFCYPMRLKMMKLGFHFSQKWLALQ